MKPFVKSAAILMVALVLVAGCDKLKGMKKSDAAPAADATAMPQEGQPAAAPAEGAAPAAPADSTAPAAAH